MMIINNSNIGVIIHGGCVGTQMYIYELGKEEICVCMCGRGHSFHCRVLETAIIALHRGAAHRYVCTVPDDDTDTTYCRRCRISDHLFLFFFHYDTQCASRNV